MSTVSTHVLDAGTGQPAADVAVTLTTAGPGTPSGQEVGAGRTDADGRVASGDLAPAGLAPGTYRITFATGDYHARTGTTGFYPEVAITFVVDEERHYHVPLLLSPYAFSTYRGS
ncbi:5-Hydroxyisourate Hydrolase (HIUase) [Serinicoccus hydrothermalis]|uniref:5-hydroxyisourate hydrolase n=1 Tax=Serinicoccus hydrothermalis TaxID=1758689 RepID=A0A1B1NDT4_9MICO|nr:hydroxyisourate hydrolase [Serinicoccus hydrothermalis]ANS79583.1 5-Hydroxyisourate Hydrolase (HIUase) [Serinicoccus hydrothermalis]